MGAVTGKDMRGDCILPFWLEQGIESSLRDSEEDTPVVSFTTMSSVPAQHSIEPSHVVSPVVLTPTESTSFTTPAIRGDGAKGPFTDLDKFYADEEDEATDEKDENSEDESDSEGQPGEHEDEEEDAGTDNSSGNPRRDA